MEESRKNNFPTKLLSAQHHQRKDTDIFCVFETGNVPHCVQIYQNFKATCTCRNFKAKHICSHTVAVTEKEGVLENLVKWYKGQNIKVGFRQLRLLTLTRENLGESKVQNAKERLKKVQNSYYLCPLIPKH